MRMWLLCKTENINYIDIFECKQWRTLADGEAIKQGTVPASCKSRSGVQRLLKAYSCPMQLSCRQLAPVYYSWRLVSNQWSVRYFTSALHRRAPDTAYRSHEAQLCRTHTLPLSIGLFA